MDVKRDAWENYTNIGSGIEFAELKSTPDDKPFDDPNAYFFIKEIAFFESCESAREYIRPALVIDLSSRNAAERVLKLDRDNSIGLFGRNSFDSEACALRLERSDSGGAAADYGSRVKFSLRMKSAGILKNSPYMVITYKTNIGSPAALKINNLQNSRENTVLSHDVSVSGGEYVRTEPKNIKLFDHPRQDYYKRFSVRVNRTSDISFGDLLCVGKDDESGFHSHNSFEFLYVIRGHATLMINKGIYPLKSGDLVAVNPTYMHNIIIDGSDTTVCSLKFLPEVLYSHSTAVSDVRGYIALWEKELDKNPLITASELTAVGIDSLLSEIVQICNSRELAYEMLVQSKLINIFVLLLRRNYSAEKAGTKLSYAMTDSFRRVMDIARSNLCDFNAADAARICNLSYNYFCSLFKQAYSISFSSYLESLRLTEAKRLLIASEMSITEIAMSAGFANASHFIRRFKATYGITPRAFRANSVGYPEG